MTNDEIIQQYLTELAEKALNAPQFASLTVDEKSQKKAVLEDRLQNIVMDVLLDNLSAEQLEELDDEEDLTSPEALEKIENYAANIPGFSDIIEKRLDQEVNAIIAGQ